MMSQKAQSENVWREYDAPIGVKPKSVPPRLMPKVKPHIDMADYIIRLRREIWLMLIVFIVLLGAGLFVALHMPQTYKAQTSLLMQLGQNYVYTPKSGDGKDSVAASIDEVVQSEIAILTSDGLKQKLVAQIGYEKLLPHQKKLWLPSNAQQKEQADKAAVQVLTSGLEVDSAPKNNVVTLGFKCEDPQTAALVLNKLVELYLSYRRDVYKNQSMPSLQVQQGQFKDRLLQADAQYQSFLDRNNVPDYQTAKQTYAKLYDQAVADGFAIDEAMVQTEAKLNSINQRLGQLSPEISLQRDLDLSLQTKINSLKQDRQELLMRYQPDSQPVKDIDNKIAGLSQDSASVPTDKDHRLGPNPVYQQLLTQKLTTEQDLAALKARKSEASKTQTEINNKLRALLSHEDEYNSLNTERESLQTNIKTYSERIEDNQAANAVTKDADQSVRLVEPASVPLKASSLRRPVAIMAVMFALMSALCVGLIRVMTRKGFGSALMASRALGLPVLGQAALKA